MRREEEGRAGLPTSPEGSVGAGGGCTGKGRRRRPEKGR